MPFFTISIPEYELHRMKISISWPDLPDTGMAEFWVTNSEQGICEVMKIERTVVAEILRRFIHQRYYALQKTDLMETASDLFAYSKQITAARSLGDICKAVRPQLLKLRMIVPGHKSIQAHWREVIDPLLEFIESYRPGDARNDTIQVIQPYNTNYYGNTL